MDEKFSRLLANKSKFNSKKFFVEGNSKRKFEVSNDENYPRLVWELIEN